MEKKYSDKKSMAVHLVNRLFRISMFLQRTGNRMLVDRGLTQPQFAVLVEIAGKQDVAQKDILGELLLEKSNLSKIIRKLENMGFIQVGVHGSDKRRSVINATEKGKREARECMAELDQLKESFAAPLKSPGLKRILETIDDLEQLVQYHQRENQSK